MKSVEATETKLAVKKDILIRPSRIILSSIGS